MEPKFEIRLISINWIAKDKIGAIKKALAPLEMDYDPELGFSADAFSYPKIDEKTTAQISVKCFDNKIAPELAHSDGSTEQLLSVQDPITKEIYWIENGDWKSIKSSNGYKFWYMDAPSHRRAGKLNIRIGDQACLINISIPKFSADEYDEILNDFKNTCWELILDVNSGVTVEDYSKTGVFSEKFYQHLTEFIRASKNILRMPHNELREKQILLKPERVRPIPRTFMELAVKGKPKTLSSRGYETSFNTPENRYIAGLAKKLSLLLYHQERISIGFSKRIKFKIKEIEKRINSYSDKFKVNPATLDFTIERERKKIEEKQKLINDIVRNNRQTFIVGKPDIIELKFKITSEPKSSNYNCSFFTDIYEYNSTPQSDLKYLLEFSHQFVDIFKRYDCFRMKVDKPQKQHFESKGKRYEKREIENIELMELIDSNEHQRSQQFEKWRKDLENNNWERVLSSKEKKLQEKEITNLKAQKKYFITEQQRWEQTISELNPLSKKVNNLVASFNKLKIKPAYRFPQSVIFVYNPDYSKVKSSFDKMMKESNIEESTFESLLTIDDYEIVDLPQVYEKWCLIKIIEMLTNVYKFAGDNWKNNLIKSVKPQSNKTTEFEFTSSAIGLNLKLFYQPVLFNHKTPDYRIDLYNFENASSNFLSDRLASLIVDAKFKDYKDQSEILDEINLLTNIKDYGERDFLSSEMNNYVFVLHPSLNKISSPTTTQNWSISSYYGGDSLLIQNQTQPDHKFGSVLFRPGEESNLQRLLIMFFQYAVEEETKCAIEDANNPEIKFDPYPRTIKKLFCPICSSAVTKNQRDKTGKNNNGREYFILCNNKKCGFEFIINYCRNCYNRLWKLGSFWTYHDTSPLSPFDIKCPHCGISNPMNIDVRRDLN